MRSETTIGLEALGWDAGHEQAFAPYRSDGCRPGRVVAEHRGGYTVSDGAEDHAASLAGRLRHGALTPQALPTVGDWVAVADGVIQAILPRRTLLARREPGSAARDQVLAANVDVAIIVTSLNRDFNLRRLERYLGLARGAGVRSLIVLSKADLSSDTQAAARAVEAIAAGAPIVVASIPLAVGLDDIREQLAPGRTAIFLGSSGVGKSTLINALAGRALQAVSAARSDDDRGRHTTTGRQLLRLPAGWLLIDTPGLREVGWADDEGLAGTFADIENLANGCRFANCGHEAEPGCAVQSAIASGVLAPQRLASLRTLELEIRAQAGRTLRHRPAATHHYRLPGTTRRPARTRHGEAERDEPES